MSWPWPWPFCHRNTVGEDAQKQQISQSIDHVLESTTRMREEARADLTVAADGAKEAVSQRLIRSSPLREILEGVIERHREMENRR